MQTPVLCRAQVTGHGEPDDSGDDGGWGGGGPPCGRSLLAVDSTTSTYLQQITDWAGARDWDKPLHCACSYSAIAECSIVHETGEIQALMANMLPERADIWHKIPSVRTTGITAACSEGVKREEPGYQPLPK